MSEQFTDEQLKELLGADFFDNSFADDVDEVQSAPILDGVGAVDIDTGEILKATIDEVGDGDGQDQAAEPEPAAEEPTADEQAAEVIEELAELFKEPETGGDEPEPETGGDEPEPETGGDEPEPEQEIPEPEPVPQKGKRKKEDGCFVVIRCDPDEKRKLDVLAGGTG